VHISHNHHLKWWFVLIIGVFLLSACSFSLAEDITPPPDYQPTEIPTPILTYPLVSPNSQKGEAIFTENCASCHGADGLGGGPQASQLPVPPIPIGDAETARQATPAYWYQVITRGNMEHYMPPFGEILSDRQRWDVLAYVFSLSASPEAIAQGELLYQQNCAQCHGDQGQGDGPQAEAPLPDFSDQQYISQTSLADFYQTVTQGVKDKMPGYAETLSDAERWTVSAYLRSFAYLLTPETTAEEATSAPTASPQPTEVAETQPGEPTPESIPNLGTVTGEVTNGSGGEVPSDLQLTLRGFDQMSEVYTRTTTIQPNSTYVFTDVEMPEGRIYLVTAEYANLTYASNFASVDAETTNLELPLTLFDTSTDASALITDRWHIFLDFPQEDILRVVELHIISNPSDRVIVPDEQGQPAITFPLPEGATNLQFQDGQLGDRYLLTEDGFGDLSPLQPGTGQYQILFAYELPYQRKVKVFHPINRPVESVIVLLPEGNIRLESDQLGRSGTKELEGSTFQVFRGASLSPEDGLEFSISGRFRPGGGQFQITQQSSLFIGLGALGVVLIVVGVWLYRRYQIEEGIAPEGSEPAKAPSALDEEDPEALMDAILALDDLFEQGELPEEAYQQRRAELKARLREILGQSEET
jgi:mono/diheme cytochrome c family protein